MPGTAQAKASTAQGEQTSPPIDQQTQYALSLDICAAAACAVALSPHKSTALKFWQANEHDKNLVTVHLIGDCTKPTETVSIGLTDLLSHSLWGQNSYNNQDNMKTCQWKQPPPVPVVLPVRTAPTVVRKLVTAL